MQLKEIGLGMHCILLLNNLPLKTENTTLNIILLLQLMKSLEGLKEYHYKQSLLYRLSKSSWVLPLQKTQTNFWPTQYYRCVDVLVNRVVISFEGKKLVLLSFFF